MTNVQNKTGWRIVGKAVANAAPLLGALLFLTHCPSTAMGQERPGGEGGERSGGRDAGFLGAKKHPKFTPSEAPTRSYVKPHLPTMDANTYDALKAQAAAENPTSSPFRSQGMAVQPRTLNITFPGLDRFGSSDQGFVFTPPDVNSAVGLGQIVEVTNNHYACYDQFGTQLQSTPMSVFFGYSTRLLTDPRVVYDSIWNRWIVTEVAFPENANTMFFFLAASQTSDCTGFFNVYSLNMPLFPNDFYDYPAVGYDQDAILTTFNVFIGQTGPLRYAEVDMWAKARVYNGLPLFVPFINGFGGTLTPNVERDQNGTTVLLRNVVNTNQVQLIKLVNTAKINPSNTTVNVTTAQVCNVPRSAFQPGTGAQLDTLDSRFQAPGTQSGAFLWNVQTCGPGLPTPRVLQINTNTNLVVQTDFVFAAGSSDDFNPSLAANDAGDLLVNWSSTNTSAGQNAGEIFASRPAGGFFNAPAECFRSTTFSTAFRWGDTSGTSVDFTDPFQQTWWTSNETIQTASNWGTQFCGISRP